jgi:hypothetical protein
MICRCHLVSAVQPAPIISSFLQTLTVHVPNFITVTYFIQDDQKFSEHLIIIYYFPCLCNTARGYGLLVHEVSGLHTNAPQSVGLLWTSDQSVSENSN